MKYTCIYCCTLIEEIVIWLNSRYSHRVVWYSISWRLCFLLTPKIFDLPSQSEQSCRLQWENEQTADAAPQIVDVASFPAEIQDHWAWSSAGVSSATCTLSFRDTRYWAQSPLLLKAHILKVLGSDTMSYYYTVVVLKISCCVSTAFILYKFYKFQLNKRISEDSNISWKYLLIHLRHVFLSRHPH